MTAFAGDDEGMDGGGRSLEHDGNQHSEEKANTQTKGNIPKGMHFES
jgi:hypothetical protein